MRNTMGEFLTILRKSKGYSQQEVADLLFVSNKTVSSWERDATAPDLSILPLLAELYKVTCDELIKGEKNTNINLGNEQAKFMTERNAKRLLHNSFEKFKRNVNLCYMIVLLAIILTLFGIASILVINQLLGIILLIISSITYITPFFLFQNFLNIANSAVTGDWNSEEKYIYYTKVYSIKKKFSAFLYFPLVFIAVYFFMQCIMSLGGNWLNPSSLKYMQIISSLLLSIYLTKVETYKEIIMNSKYNASEEVKNKIIDNNKLSGKLIRFYLCSTFISVLICIACRVLIQPKTVKITDTNEFLNYAQTYVQNNNHVTYGISIDYLLNEGYAIIQIEQESDNKVLVLDNVKEEHRLVYVFINDECKLQFLETEIIKNINVESESKSFYMINRDIIKYEYKNNKWEIKTHSAINKVKNINGTIFKFALLTQGALFVAFAIYYSKNKHQIILFNK